MARNFMALALFVGMCTVAAADVVSNIQLNFTTVASLDNELSATLGMVSWGYDTQTVAVKSGSYAKIDIDCTVDSATRAITSVNYIDFVGGNFKLDNTQFKYGYNVVDMNNVLGPFETPSPHGSATSGTPGGTSPYELETTFPTDEHNIKLSSGTFVYTPLMGTASTYNLGTDGAFYCNTQNETATLTTELDHLDGSTAYYNVSMEFPVDFYYSITDPNDRFSYFAATGNLVATGTFTMEEPNLPPVAVDDYYEIDKNGSLMVYVYEGLLINDTDVNEDPLTAYRLSDPLHGSITWWPSSNDGSFVYQPATGFVGQDSFTYYAFDGEYYSDSATVWINVVPEPSTMILLLTGLAAVGLSRRRAA